MRCYTKAQEVDKQGLISKSVLINPCEKFKYNKYLSICNDNNTTFIPFAITQEVYFTEDTNELINKITHYGGGKLKRSHLTSEWFLKCLAIQIIKDQSYIINQKITNLAD